MNVVKTFAELSALIGTLPKTAAPKPPADIPAGVYRVRFSGPPVMSAEGADAMLRVAMEEHTWREVPWRITETDKAVVDAWAKAIGASGLGDMAGKTGARGGVYVQLALHNGELRVSAFKGLTKSEAKASG